MGRASCNHKRLNNPGWGGVAAGGGGVGGGVGGGQSLRHCVSGSETLEATGISASVSAQVVCSEESHLSDGSCLILSPHET